MDWGEWAITNRNKDFMGEGGEPTGDEFWGSPNIDHKQPKVQEDICEWIQWLTNDVGFGGIRFDFSKGYGGGRRRGLERGEDVVHARRLDRGGNSAQRLAALELLHPLLEVAEHGRTAVSRRRESLLDGSNLRVEDVEGQRIGLLVRQDRLELGEPVGHGLEVLFDSLTAARGESTRGVLLERRAELGVQAQARGLRGRGGFSTWWGGWGGLGRGGGGGGDRRCELGSGRWWWGP